jgi:hypothetical protein
MGFRTFSLPKSFDGRKSLRETEAKSATFWKVILDKQGIATGRFSIKSFGAGQNGQKICTTCDT